MPRLSSRRAEAKRKKKYKESKEDKSAAIVAKAKKGAFTVNPKLFNKYFFEKAKKGVKLLGKKLSGRTRVKFVCKVRKNANNGGSSDAYSFTASLLSGEQIGGVCESSRAIGELIGFGGAKPKAAIKK